jgi:hypothetical protein
VSLKIKPDTGYYRHLNETDADYPAHLLFHFNILRRVIHTKRCKSRMLTSSIGIYKYKHGNKRSSPGRKPGRNCDFHDAIEQYDPVEDLDAYTYNPELYNKNRTMAVLDEIVPYALALADPEVSADKMREILHLPTTHNSSNDESSEDLHDPTNQTNHVITDSTNAVEDSDSGYSSQSDEANNRTKSSVSQYASALQTLFLSDVYLFSTSKLLILAVYSCVTLLLAHVRHIAVPA